MTLSAYELFRFVLIMLGIGLIGGIPIGAWITTLPVPDQRTTPPADEEATR